jgi:hypothetical protein
MRKIRTAVLAGAATFLFAGAAVAATGKMNTMQVDLPDGAVATITYSGDVAPRVEVRPVEASEIAIAEPFAFSLIPGFAHFERIAAMLDAQREAMMRRIAEMERHAALVSSPDGMVQVSGNLPAGTWVSYRFTSTSDGQTTCTQSVEWRSDGSGAEPRVTRVSSGDCGAVQQGDTVVPVSAPASTTSAPADPDMI